MARERPRWHPMPPPGPAARGEAVLAAFERNLREAAAHDPAALSSTRSPGNGDTMASNMAEELAQLLEDDLRGMAGRIAHMAEVDWDRVKASGRSRPRLVLDAAFTSAGNLSITVSPGMSGLHGLPSPLDDWKAFPLYGPDSSRRPCNEVAFIRHAMVLSYGRGHGGTGFDRETRLNALGTLSGLVLEAWGHCKRALSEHYEVEEGFAPVLDGEAPAEGPDTRSLRIALPAAHVALLAQEREDALLNGALALLREYGGDPRALVARWRDSPRDKRASRALASELDAGGVRVNPLSAWARLARIDAALHIVEPGWDVAPPAPVAAPVPDAGGGGAGEESDVVETVVPHPAGRDAGEAPSASAALRSRFRPVGHYPVPPPPARDEVSDARFYARLPRYAATAEELVALSATSVDELVGRVNDGLRATGRSRIPQGDFPSSEKRFRKMLRLHADLVEAPPAMALSSP